jgi:hypothetical protein
MTGAAKCIGIQDMGVIFVGVGQTVRRIELHRSAEVVKCISIYIWIYIYAHYIYIYI